MSTPPAWILLGSSLYVRPAVPDDAERIESFLKRRNLVRIPESFGAASAGNGTEGILLLGLDSWGAPAAVFSLTAGGPEAALSVAVPPQDPQALREGLRMIALAAPRRMEAARLTLGPVEPGPGLRALLVDLGWSLEEDGAWSRVLTRVGEGESDAD